jgi:NAD-dependent deacetylase
MEERLARLLLEVREEQGLILVLTGAGISAESGIPTFRGKEGYWVVGSRNYEPQEMATWAMFCRAPEEVWRWYLFRFGVYRDARPNDGHRALVDLEHALGDRFLLVTQNIDGLHRKAGSSPGRTYCIHGDSAWVRCAQECTTELFPMPDLVVPTRDALPPRVDRQALSCPRCGGWLRPHVLWFDECYDEKNYRMESTLRATAQASLLLVVGTSGATNLPMQMGQIAFRRGAALVDVDPDENPFAEMAMRSPRGFFARGTACERLPEIVRWLTGEAPAGAL